MVGKPSYEELEKRVRDLEALTREYEEIHQSLHVARERLNLSLSAGNLAWWEWNVAENRVDFNENKVRMLGFERSDFPTPCPYAAFTDLLHPDDHEKTMQAMRDHLSGKKPLYEAEYRIRHKDGSYRWFYDRGSVTKRSPDSSPAELKGIVFDATVRKTAEIALVNSQRALKESNAAKNRLFSILGHDLRNSIGNLAELLKVMVEKPEVFSESEFREILAALRDSSDQTYHTMENLLHWSHDQSEAITISRQFHRLANIVEEESRDMRLRAELKKVELTTEITGDLKCSCDKNMMGVVVRNLISNAIKFTPSGGAVVVKAYEKGSNNIVVVQDSGIGMDPATIASLFNLSSDRKRSGTQGERGYGLGLILCRDFVERHGGKLDIESRPGEGSAFTVTIPSMAPQSPSD